MKTIIGLSGTTSVGKSAVAVELAKLLNTEVISADSMQIYKGMDIGTAKITSSEMQGVKHHMLDVVEPDCNYSSFLYQQEASAIIDAMSTIPIVVGGTGFYFDCLLYPPEFGAYEERRRAELKSVLAEQGLDALIERLRMLDADTCNSIDLRNAKRVIRAIEIAEYGQSRSNGRGKREEPKYDCKMFILQRDRQSLYDKIDKRVDEMIEKGLVDEVKQLVREYGKCDTSAFSAIGYKEIIEYLDGTATLDAAIEKIKLNTRHYAKRQITYFKKMNATHIDVDDLTISQTVNIIINSLKSLKVL